MLSKWWWRFRTDENALWCNIIRSIHGPSGGLDDASYMRSKRGPWYHIAKLKDDFLTIGINLPSLFKKKIGNGRNTRFLLDNWLGGACLYEPYPRLFRLEANPDCLVHDRAPTFVTIPSVHTTAESLSHSAYDGNSNPGNGLRGLCFNWVWGRPIRSDYLTACLPSTLTIFCAPPCTTQFEPIFLGLTFCSPNLSFFMDTWCLV
ncbi:RNA-directed DNA polymerase, eukaryota, Reverse transcriptase zinc-binding domain protein [Artemisia annua]|uniref:RNA-directed DNA polymerase, eukaryota, Reverse transcriptase zinc-binding domain protein n=1 Tax=Artemisia annua TaxID=35608 RepID=A0A2U1L0X4_ARTAN|nr:RNA-directed DNA polymerase, eukaryota, Reverse transcriptase zinc-binding domain protein [Artemisia annua]